MSPRLCAGSVETSSTRPPSRARAIASPEEIEGLPVPPLPPTKRRRRERAMSNSMRCGPAANGAVPCGDARRGVVPEGWHELGRVVGGGVGHAEGLAEDDDGEEVVLGLLLSFERLPVGADIELEQPFPERRPLLGQRPETAGDLLCDGAWHCGIRHFLALPP